MSERRRIMVAHIGDLATVRFNDRALVDGGHIEEMYGELCSLIETDKIKHLSLDFEAVKFISSAALSKFIMVDKKVKQVDGHLRLCNLRPELLKVFTITHLDSTFDIRRPNRDDDDTEDWGAWVPNPTPPDDLDGSIERRTDGTDLE